MAKPFVGGGRAKAERRSSCPLNAPTRSGSIRVTLPPPLNASSRGAGYFRTSSAANVGPDKDSEARQRDAVMRFAKARKLTIVVEFSDAAVSGADPVDSRAGFCALLAQCAANAISVVLVENASRFARDPAVQLAGDQLLRTRGIDLIPVDAPDHFTDPNPTAENGAADSRGRVTVREIGLGCQATSLSRAQAGRDWPLRRQEASAVGDDS